MIRLTVFVLLLVLISIGSSSHSPPTFPLSESSESSVIVINYNYMMKYLREAFEDDLSDCADVLARRIISDEVWLKSVFKDTSDVFERALLYNLKIKIGKQFFVTKNRRSHASRQIWPAILLPRDVDEKVLEPLGNEYIEDINYSCRLPELKETSGYTMSSTKGSSYTMKGLLHKAMRDMIKIYLIAQTEGMKGKFRFSSDSYISICLTPPQSYGKKEYVFTNILTNKKEVVTIENYENIDEYIIENAILTSTTEIQASSQVKRMKGSDITFINFDKMLDYVMTNTFHIPIPSRDRESVRKSLISQASTTFFLNRYLNLLKSFKLDEIYPLGKHRIQVDDWNVILHGQKVSSSVLRQLTIDFIPSVQVKNINDYVYTGSESLNGYDNLIKFSRRDYSKEKAIEWLIEYAIRDTCARYVAFHLLSNTRELTGGVRYLVTKSDYKSLRPMSNMNYKVSSFNDVVKGFDVISEKEVEYIYSMSPYDPGLCKKLYIRGKYFGCPELLSYGTNKISLFGDTLDCAKYNTYSKCVYVDSAGNNRYKISRYNGVITSVYLIASSVSYSPSELEMFSRYVSNDKEYASLRCKNIQSYVMCEATSKYIEPRKMFMSISHELNKYNLSAPYPPVLKQPHSPSCEDSPICNDDFVVELLLHAIVNPESIDSSSYVQSLLNYIPICKNLTSYMQDWMESSKKTRGTDLITSLKKHGSKNCSRDWLGYSFGKNKMAELYCGYEKTHIEDNYQVRSNLRGCLPDCPKVCGELLDIKGNSTILYKPGLYLIIPDMSKLTQLERMSDN